jgi:RNA binding exosome subunit
LISINDKSVLENDELIVRFDKRTFMPNQIEFKKLNQIIDLKVEVIRYPSGTSETGAYISAPKSRGVPLKLQIVDA